MSGRAARSGETGAYRAAVPHEGAGAHPAHDVHAREEEVEQAEEERADVAVVVGRVDGARVGAVRVGAAVDGQRERDGAQEPEQAPHLRRGVALAEGP